MKQEENSTQAYADAGSISATFSENPMQHHACGGEKGHQLVKSYWPIRRANTACRQNPARSTLQTLRL
jgi:hypothetical protein